MKRILNISGLCILTLLLGVIHPVNAIGIGIYHNVSGTWYIDTDSDRIFSAGIDQQFQFGAPNFNPVLGDWNGDGRNKIGVYNDGAWYLDYDGSGTWSDGDKVYYFGAPGWINVTGDWNNDGRTDIGITNGQQWYLDMNNNGAFDSGVDKAYNFGAPGWTPIVSDWNATGSSYIGVTNGQQWYLDWNGNGAWDSADKAYNFGAPGWTPVLGDWNGDGKTEIGVTNGQRWYLDWNGNGAWDGADKTYNFGAPGWTPVLGDWNGDGSYKIGVFKDGIWYLDYTGEGTWTANDKVFSFGTTGDSPIILKIIEIPASPAVAFTSDKQSGTAPLSITFTDQSTGNPPLIYAWDFTNDGSVDSTQASPSHIYTAAGTYSVKLTVTNSAGSDSELKTGYITVTAAPLAPTADFTSNKQSGTAPLTITFTDKSTGTAPLTYAWDFDNDGVNESTAKSPTFTYSTPGTYSVKLTTTNVLGSDAGLKTGYITVTPMIPPSAAFTTNKQSGTTPLTVRFTDQSTGTTPMTYAWDFNNDGINESTTQNPSFTYTGTGTYSVKLIATNAAGSDAELKTGYITVNAAAVAPNAAFKSDVQTGTAPLMVAFTDQSTGTAPLTYAWDFTNDGSVDSTQASPSHIYTAAGTYSVKLTATNSAGSDSELKTSYITVTAVPMAPMADFTSNKQSGTAPLTITFTDKSTGTTPFTYAWDFDNDGVNESTSKSPSFTYSNPGTYSVILTTTNDLGSDTELKTGYITVTPVIGPTAAFTSNKQSGTTPLTVRFTDQSTGTAPMTYAWDFNNDGINESTIQNPSFTYSSTGTYSVKLTTTNTAGSESEIKTDYITVYEAPPSSTHAGVALTFDDNAVTNWYAIQDLLKKYNAHATFYVSSFGGRSAAEINMLKTMKENGHEIAFHGAHHTDVNEYLSSHSIDEYLNYEIIPGIDLMKNAGLNPVDFAYPYGSENDAVTAVLETYFTHIRGTAYHESGKLKDVDSVFYQYGSNEPHIYGIGVDDTTYGNSLEDIYDGILRAKGEDKILIFYAHTPVESNPQSYQITYDRLEKILINASENNMKFYKISEIN